MFSGIKFGFARSVLLSSAVFLCVGECLAAPSKKSGGKKSLVAVSNINNKINNEFFLNNKTTPDNSFTGFTLSFGLVQSKSDVTFDHAVEAVSVLADVRAKDNYLDSSTKALVTEPYTEFFISSDRWKNFMRMDMTGAECKYVYDSSEKLTYKTVRDYFWYHSGEIKIEPYDFMATFVAGENVIYDKASEIPSYLRTPDVEYRKKTNALHRRNFYNFQDWIKKWNNPDEKKKILEQGTPFIRENESFLYLMPLAKKNGLRTFKFSQKRTKYGETLALNYRKGFKKSQFLFGCGIDLCFVPRKIRVQDNTDYTDLNTTKIIRFYEPVKAEANSVRELTHKDFYNLKDGKSDIDVVIRDPNDWKCLLGIVYPSTFGMGNFGRFFFSRQRDGSVVFSADNFYFLNFLAYAEFYSEKIYDIIKSKEPMTNEIGRFLEPGKASDYYAEFMNKVAINEDTGKLMYYDFQTKRNSVVPSFDITFGRKFLDNKVLFEIFCGISYVQAKTSFKAKTMLSRYGFPERPHVITENIHKIAPSFGFNICYQLSERVNCFSKVRYIGKVRGAKTKLGRTILWSAGVGFKF